MLIFRLAIRNAQRNLRRSLLTALTIALGTAILTVALTWEQGVFGQIEAATAAMSGHVRVVRKAFAEREEMQPLSANFAQSDPVIAEIRKIPGVTDVAPRIITGATLSLGESEEIGEVFAPVIGAPASWFADHLGLGKDLAGGRLLQAKGEMMLGGRVAKRLGAKVGDRVLLLGMTQDGAMSPIEGTVVGVVSAGNAIVDQGVFLGLEDIRYMADIPEGATELLVYTADRDQAPAVAAAIRATSVGEHDVSAWSERDPMKTMLQVTGTIRVILSGVIVFITALGVWNTMTMSVLERTGEIGVMRALGLGRLGAVSLFVIEAIGIAVVGGAVGVAIGSLGGFALETWGVDLGDKISQNMSGNLPMQSKMYGDLSWSVVGISFLLGLSMAVFGAAFPAMRAAQIKPVEAMRQRR
jgi:putative ABC transport system permease protein